MESNKKFTVKKVENGRDERKGITLKELMERGGAPTQEIAVQLAMQLCREVGYLHAQQPPIFCGNINPENVILKPDGKIALLDFCALPVEKELHLPDDGTDERTNEKADEKTDIYYIGMMLYYLLTECYIGEDSREMKPISEINNPLISDSLKKIIIKSTQADPADRYQSVDQMLRALKRCLTPQDKPRTLQVLKESILKRMRPASNREQDVPADDRTACVIPSEFPSMPAAPSTANPTVPAAFSPKADVTVSQVSFSAVVPKRFIKGEYAMIEISVYEEMFRNVVDRIIANADTEVKEVVGGIQDVEAGTMIQIKLSSSDIELTDCEETQRWSGKYLIFDFPVEVPDDYAKKQIQFTASVYFNGIIATKLKFIANCTSLREQKLEVIREDVLTAFMSYASQDRAEVATIIQGMKKIRPDLDVFFDVDNLRSGEYWEKALKSEIEKRDILYLCWSKFAKESEWVEKEWKYALQNKGIDSIEPVSLVSPSECPPPEELKAKHFNDKALLYKKM